MKKHVKIRFDKLITPGKIRVLLLLPFFCFGCGVGKETMDLRESNLVNGSEGISDTTNSLKSKDGDVDITDNSITDVTETTELEQDHLQDFKKEEKAEAIMMGEEDSCQIIMVGDVLLHDRVEDSAKKETGVFDFSMLFSHTKDAIEAADLALVNQEVILGGVDCGISGYPNFNGPFEVGDALVEAGFDVICHGTNHALDRGGKGIQNCTNFWAETYPDILVTGIHNSMEEKERIPTVQWGDKTIAILNYTYGTNGISLPSDMPYVVSYLKEEEVIADIKKAEEIADFTICCPHWGTEYQLSPDSMQNQWTQIFLENGVDLVIGTHPHVIEPIEWVEDENTGNRMLVYYSLGNYVNWTSGTGTGTANRMVGGMASVTLSENERGELEIVDYGVKALISHVESGFGGVSSYFFSDYSEELAMKNQIRLQDDSFSYQYVEKLCDQVWGDCWE